MNEKIIKEVASRASALDEDDFNISDWSGNNIDDAFWLGYNAGQIALARELLKDKKNDKQ